MKVALQIRRLTNGSIGWTRAFPFFVNPRGILTHRVRSVTTHCLGGIKSHHSVSYWCGNCTCFEIGNEAKVLVAVPPADRLLCAWCEARATAARRGKADTLAGRHVHLGVLKAHRICCRGDEN